MADLTQIKYCDALRTILKASNDTPLERVDWAEAIRLYDEYQRDKKFTDGGPTA